MFAPGFSDAYLKTDFVMLGAMYGNYGISIPLRDDGSGFDGSKAEWGFGKGGKMRHQAKPQNTTISAIITLHQVRVGQAKLFEWHENHPNENVFDPDLQKKVDFEIGETRWGVIVWENEYAAIPFPRDLFSGPYDERWGSDGDGKVRQIFEGQRLREINAVYPEAISPLSLATNADDEADNDPLTDEDFEDEEE